jgi:hypothetical protein
MVMAAPNFGVSVTSLDTIHSFSTEWKKMNTRGRGVDFSKRTPSKTLHDANVRDEMPCGSNNVIK